MSILVNIGGTILLAVLAHLWGIRLGRKWERQAIREYVHHRGQYDLGSFKVIDIGTEIEQCCHRKGPPVPDDLKARCDRERAKHQVDDDT